jgi:hypothetical protein
LVVDASWTNREHWISATWLAMACIVSMQRVMSDSEGASSEAAENTTTLAAAIKMVRITRPCLRTEQLAPVCWLTPAKRHASSSKHFT